MCVDTCPNGFEMKDEKSVVKDPNASCITEAISACPAGAIKSDTENSAKGPTRLSGIGRGRGGGRGRGLGIGPRDGRGRGRGGGGRRR